MTTYRIIRRAFSTYAEIELFSGNYLDATLRAMDLQFANKDGEYLVKRLDQPNWEPTQYQQPYMD